jgi:hypothetical protein
MTFLPSPLEALQNIAACVERVHRPSLYASSLTSKACHQAAAFLVFWHIVITVYNRKALRRDVDRLVEALTCTESSRHIRCITIKGDLKLKAKKTEGYSQQTPCLVTTGLDEVLMDEEPVFFHDLCEVYDEAVIKKSTEEDMAWAPVVSLLQADMRLNDLVYDCQSQFPPSLLRFLHEQHPQCRLHHLTFKFRTLLWGDPYLYEMKLATSPSLYRAKLVCAPRDSDGDDDFNLEAMMELTAGISPNLKEVIVLNLLPAGSTKSLRPRGSWQGLPGFAGGNLARTRFCARCHRLFDNWPTLGASSTREHDSEPGPKEGWEYAIAVSYTTCELEGSACSGCKLCFIRIAKSQGRGTT